MFHGFFIFELNFRIFQMENKTIQFSAIIQQNADMNAAFVEFPFSTEELFNKKDR